MKNIKKLYEFLYTDENGEDLYLYGSYKLTLEQIYKCETNYMTKACIISNGHICKELDSVYEYYDVVEETDIYTGS